MWVGAVMDPSGHADELRGFLRALERHGYEPAVRERPGPRPAPACSPAEIEQIERQKRRGRRSADHVVVHEYLPGDTQCVFDGAVNIARVMFETDRLPSQWLDARCSTATRSGCRRSSTWRRSPRAASRASG